MKQEPTEQTEIADIIQTLVVLSRGKFILNAGRELQELADAIVDTGKKGSLTIKLEVAPSGLKNGRINQFEIRPDVSINKPKHDQSTSVFFVTEDNKLVRDDPDQMEMGFEESEKTNGRR